MNNKYEHATANLKLTHAQIERYATFIFGIVFLSAMIILAIWIPEPSKTQFFTFKVAICLAAAGVGALLPGALELKIPLIPTGVIKTGGAIGLFVIVWYTDPAKYAIDRILPPPAADAPAIAEEFLKKIGKKDYQEAYISLAKSQRLVTSEQTFRQLSENVVAPLGSRIKGPLISNSFSFDQFNGTAGTFVGIQYQVRYENRTDVWMENVVLVAEDGDWKIQSYTVAPCSHPYCNPVSNF